MYFDVADATGRQFDLRRLQEGRRHPEAEAALKRVARAARENDGAGAKRLAVGER